MKLHDYSAELCVQIGLPSPPAHTNAIIMILTLKMVGLAFEASFLYVTYPQRRKTKREREREGESSCIHLVRVNLAWVGGANSC